MEKKEPRHVGEGAGLRCDLAEELDVRRGTAGELGREEQRVIATKRLRLLTCRPREEDATSEMLLGDRGFAERAGESKIDWGWARGRGPSLRERSGRR
jgi:hypothetical protein